MHSSDSTSGVTSVTWTLSVTWPTSNLQSAVTCAWVATIIPFRSNLLETRGLGDDTYKSRELLR